MIKLKNILLEINKNSLEYFSSITTDINEPFNPPRYLYHLSSQKNIDSILRSGLHPGTPEPSMHSGKVKGEQFSGVWLTPIDNVDEIVDAHYLPDEFYDGTILQVDTSKLDKMKFSIGIEYNTLTPPFSRQEYLDKTDEIIYLDKIPTTAIKVL